MMIKSDSLLPFRSAGMSDEGKGATSSPSHVTDSSVMLLVHGPVSVFPVFPLAVRFETKAV